MLYCPNCGTKLEEGDLFCPNCGAKISEQENQNVANGYKPINSSVSVDRANISSIFQTILKMFLKPVSSAKKFIEKSNKNDVVMTTVLLMIIQGILGVWKVSQIISSLQSEMLSLMKKIAGLMSIIQQGSSSGLSSSDVSAIGKEISQFKAYINVPYGKIFLQNCVLFLGAIIVIFIIVYIGLNIVSKNKLEIINIYKAILISIVPILDFEILSIVVSYMSFSFGILIGILGIIISAICFSTVLRDVLLIDQDSSTILTAVSYVIGILVVILFLNSFVSSNVSDIVRSIKNYSNSLLNN